MVGLHENDVRVPLAGNPLQRANEGGGYAAPAMSLGDRQIVDVDLASVLLEFVQLVSDKPPGNLAGAVRGNEHDHVRLRKQRLEIGIARNGVLVRGDVFECFAKNSQKSLQRDRLAGQQLSERVIHPQHSSRRNTTVNRSFWTQTGTDASHAASSRSRFDHSTSSSRHEWISAARRPSPWHRRSSAGSSTGKP